MCISVSFFHSFSASLECKFQLLNRPESVRKPQAYQDSENGQLNRIQPWLILIFKPVMHQNIFQEKSAQQKSIMFVMRADQFVSFFRC